MQQDHRTVQIQQQSGPIKAKNSTRLRSCDGNFRELRINKCPPSSVNWSNGLKTCEPRVLHSKARDTESLMSPKWDNCVDAVWWNGLPMTLREYAFETHTQLEPVRYNITHVSNHIATYDSRVKIYWESMRADFMWGTTRQTCRQPDYILSDRKFWQQPYTYMLGMNFIAVLGAG